MLNDELLKMLVEKLPPEAAERMLNGCMGTLRDGWMMTLVGAQPKPAEEPPKQRWVTPRYGQRVRIYAISDDFPIPQGSGFTLGSEGIVESFSTLVPFGYSGNNSAEATQFCVLVKSQSSGMVTWQPLKNVEAV